MKTDTVRMFGDFVNLFKDVKENSGNLYPIVDSTLPIEIKATTRSIGVELAIKGITIKGFVPIMLREFVRKA